MTFRSMFTPCLEFDAIESPYQRQAARAAPRPATICESSRLIWAGGKSASPSSNAATQAQWRYNKANERTSWPSADLACTRSLAARARRTFSGTRLPAQSAEHDEPRQDSHRTLAMGDRGNANWGTK